MGNLAKNYTHADVERLVGQIEDTMKTGTISHWHLNEALEPFQPDAEEELVAKVDRIRRVLCPNRVSAEITREIIAAVREHDAKHGRSS